MSEAWFEKDFLDADHIKGTRHFSRHFAMGFLQAVQNIEEKLLPQIGSDNTKTLIFNALVTFMAGYTINTLKQMREVEFTDKEEEALFGLLHGKVGDLLHEIMAENGAKVMKINTTKDEKDG